MPAFANTQNPAMLQNLANTIQFIITKEIELSGSAHAGDLSSLVTTGERKLDEPEQMRLDILEAEIGGLVTTLAESQITTADLVKQMQEQLGMLTEAQGVLMEKLGATAPAPAPV